MRPYIPARSLELKFQQSVSEGGRRAIWCVSSNPSRWLDIIDSLRLGAESMRILPVHGYGALILHTHKSVIYPDMDCQAYKWRFESIWIPVNSELSSPLSQKEADDFLPTKNYVFHPQAGIWEFNEKSVLLVCDLYNLPEKLSSQEKWSATLEGLTSINMYPEFVPAPVASDEWFQEIQNQIRTGDINAIIDQFDLQDSKAPDNLIEHFKQQILRKSSSVFLKQRPKSYSEHQQESSSGSHTGQIKAQYRNNKNRDLDRLIQLYETDPEKALGFSPRIGDEDMSRGSEPPTVNGIGKRRTEFNIADFRTASPAHTFYIPESYKRQLKKYYLELAKVNTSKGNFEKAAYIFGYLLGDFHAAADCLRKGKLYYEASVIYMEKSGNHSLAADCLADGKFHRQAAEIYAQIGNYEKAAKHFADAGQETDARECILRAIQISGSRLERARLYFEFLNVPELAIEELSRGWPTGPEAKICQFEHFRLLQLSDRGDSIESFLTRLSESHNKISPAYLQIDNLVEMVKIAETPEYKSRISDMALILAGKTLNETRDKQTRKHIFMRIPRLRPEDPILRSDTQRYSNMPDGEDSTLSISRPAPSGTLVPTELFHFSNSHDWKSLTCAFGVYVGLGHARSGTDVSVTIAVKSRMTGQSHDFNTGLAGNSTIQVLHLGKKGIFLHPGKENWNQAPHQPTHIPDTHPATNSALPGLHWTRGLPPEFAAIGDTDDEWIPVIISGENGNQSILQLYDTSGALRESRLIPTPEKSHETGKIMGVMRRQNACLVIDSRTVFCLLDDGDLYWMESLETIIFWAVPAGNRALSRILLLTENSLSLHEWAEAKSVRIINGSERSQDILDVSMTPKGHPVILKMDRVIIFQNEHPFQQLYEIKLFPGTKIPSGLGHYLETASCRFSVLFTDGYVQVYEIP